ncbi:unnamed protein product [Ceutorhynchus assimilis]|uniref:DUF7869 domain-containing protein n=1 Tax=Ceutorhynchus assimilis TaxID=467358 RepID=A0A9N9QR70_9CUCU|nr:unnamed protein product [Ceutorhynchus assimilis]
MKTSGAVVPTKDMRGEHENRPNTLSADQEQSVRNHIEAIPKYQSHYSRANNMNETYLNCDMSIAGLYKEYYVPWCQQQNIEPVKESAYRKIFCSEYNIGFKLPKSAHLKVWLYNLGVHDSTAGQGYMYLWIENQAKRGADEVASVIFKFLKSKSEVDHPIIYTNNCPGQNKNWLLMAFGLQLVEEKRFKTITHRFLVSGHTHLPSDRDFALIEKRHRKYAPEIYSPEGWHKIIKDANSKNSFNVTVMKQNNFFSFDPI